MTTTVVDVPTRPGVTQRFLYVCPDAPVATIVSLAGGDGVLGILDDGTMTTTAACNPVAQPACVRGAELRTGAGRPHE